MTPLRTLIALIPLAATAVADETWTPLFDGKSLDGWTRRGGVATYTVEDGCIVGTSVAGTPNTFLCTARDYGDFIFEYEFKVDPRLNSGVQIRSQCFDHDTTITWQGKPVKVPANRVHGYQVEIDPEPGRDRWWSGGLYEEGGRGWLYPGILGGDGAAFTAQGRAVFVRDGWNKVRVEALGDAITTTLNGAPCAAVIDGRVARGFIGLQVHNIGRDKAKEGTRVRWRNLRIQEIAAAAPNTLSTAEQAAGWRLLWDGKSTAGWRSARGPQFPQAGWVIKDGVLAVVETGGGESAAAGDIITTEKFSDFEFTGEFALTPGANSGFKFFVDPALNRATGSSLGLEFQILDDERHPDAKLGKDGNRRLGSLYDLIPAPADKTVMPTGEWNRARVLARGNRVDYWLNGVKTVSFERGTPAWRALVAGSKFKEVPGFGELPEGHILLQEHGNEVKFRNLKIRPLAKGR